MKSKIMFVLCLLMGLMLVNSGFNKFFHYQDMPEMPADVGALMGAFANSGWLFPLIAVVEIIGGILFIIPKYRAIGAIILLPVIVGIFLLHLTQDPAPLGMIISIVFLAITFWVIIDNKDRYMHLIA